MLIEMPEDNSIIRWKYKDKWKCAEISDLILAYEKQERPQGEWIEGFHEHFETLDCSCCGYVRNERHLTLNFCPNCGAKMKQD